jgi:hypothetical protein
MTFPHKTSEKLNAMHESLIINGWEIDAEYRDRIVFRKYSFFGNNETIIYQTVFNSGKIQRGDHRPR